MEEMAWLPWLFFGVWTCIGGVFLLVAWFMRRARLRKLERCVMTAPGVVVAMAYRRGNEYGGSYHPVVEFSANGRVLRVSSNYGSTPARYAEGERVVVRYDPEKPSRFYLEGDPVPVLLERIFLFVGLGCVLIGSLVAFFVGRLMV